MGGWDHQFALNVAPMGKITEITIDRSRQIRYVLAINLGGVLMEAYCFKCRMKREIRNPTPVTFKNGRLATQGTCLVCGTKVVRIGRA